MGHTGLIVLVLVVVLVLIVVVRAGDEACVSVKMHNNTVTTVTIRCTPDYLPMRCKLTVTGLPALDPCVPHVLITFASTVLIPCTSGSATI